MNQMCYNNRRESITQFNTQRYRSGHNGADSKSVCAKAHEGSNPSLCARKSDLLKQVAFSTKCALRHMKFARK